MKTLNEFIATMPDPTRDVYIAMEGGSGWMWIAPGTLLKDPKRINKMDKVLKDRTKERLKSTQKNADQSIRLHVLAKEIVKAFDDLSPENEAYANKYIRDTVHYLSLADKQYKLITELTDYLDAWVPLGDRPVVETYEKTEGEGGVAVFVPGTKEAGCLWYKHDKTQTDIYAI